MGVQTVHFCTLLILLLFFSSELPAKATSQTLSFRWSSGSPDQTDVSGIYGTKGIPDSANVPGGREGHAIWASSDGSIYVFGGMGKDINGDTGFLNDLWRWKDDKWTWVHGSNQINSPGDYSSFQISSPTSSPEGKRLSCYTADNNDRFWLFGGQANNKQTTNDLWYYRNNTWTWVSGTTNANDPGSTVPPIPAARAECSMVPDEDDEDKIYVMFGSASGNYYSDVWRYSISSNSWALIHDGGVNRFAYYGEKGVYLSQNTPGSRKSTKVWFADGGIYLFGGIHQAAIFGLLITVARGDVWFFNIAMNPNQWVWIAGSDHGVPSWETKGVESPSVEPPPYIEHTLCHSKHDKTVYIIGGMDNPESETSYHDASFRFNYQTNLFTWTSGQQTTSDHFEHGTRGFGDNQNKPLSKRYMAATYSDYSRRCFMFGGKRNDLYNDLWEYETHYVCNGTNRLNDDVCNFKGRCLGSEFCSCIEGFGSQYCNHYKCWEYSADEPEVCSFGNGTCVGSFHCDCNDGYLGDLCEIPVCYGTNANQSNVCSSRGQCIKKDQCTCEQNYVGENCEMHLCFGIRNDSNTVCSGKGDCVDVDTCECIEGFKGENCHILETFITSDILQPQIWTKEHDPYHIQGLINVRANLTIEPGVEVRFHGVDTALFISTQSLFYAVGTLQEPILFTSKFKTKGSWRSIQFQETAWCSSYDQEYRYQGGSIIENAIIEYGAASSTYGMVEVNCVAGVFMKNVTIRHGTTSGVFATKGILIQDSLIHDTDMAIHQLAHGFPFSVNTFIWNNTFTNSGPTFAVLIQTYTLETSNDIIISHNFFDGTSLETDTALKMSQRADTYITHNNFQGYKRSHFELYLTSAMQNDNQFFVRHNQFSDITTSTFVLNMYHYTLPHHQHHYVEYNTFENIVITNGNPIVYMRAVVSREYQHHFNHNVMRNNLGNLVYFYVTRANSPLFCYNNTLDGNTVRNYAVRIYRPQGSNPMSYFQYNSIRNTQVTASSAVAVDILLDARLTMNFNLFEISGSDYIVRTSNPSNIITDASLNWWGSNDTLVFQSKIFDFFISATVGVLSYSPFLSEDHFGAPLIYDADSGIIYGNQVWTLANSPYTLHRHVIIDEDASLTVEPGVQIYLHPGVSMLNGGRLIMEGNESLPIRMDPAVGGTFWGGITFTETAVQSNMQSGSFNIIQSGSYFKHVIMEYCGEGVSGVIFAPGKRLFVEYLTMRHIKSQFGVVGTHTLYVGHSYFAHQLPTQSNSYTVYSTSSVFSNISNNHFYDIKSRALYLYHGQNNNGYSIVRNNIFDTMNAAYFHNLVGHTYVSHNVFKNTNSFAIHWRPFRIYDQIIENNQFENSKGNTIIIRMHSGDHGNVHISNNTVTGFQGRVLNIYMSHSNPPHCNFFGLIEHNIFANGNNNNGEIIMAQARQLCVTEAFKFFNNTFMNIQNAQSIITTHARNRFHHNYLINIDASVQYMMKGVFEVVDTVDARYNYWDSDDENAIQPRIYDFFVSSASGIIEFKPFLMNPHHNSELGGVSPGDEIIWDEDITITDDLIIPMEKCLIVLPGVTVKVVPDVLILIKGCIKVLGNATHPVLFTSLDTNSFWNSIILDSGATGPIYDSDGNWEDGSIFRYANIVNGGGDNYFAFNLGTSLLFENVNFYLDYVGNVNTFGTLISSGISDLKFVNVTFQDYPKYILNSVPRKLMLYDTTVLGTQGFRLQSSMWSELVEFKNCNFFHVKANSFHIHRSNYIHVENCVFQSCVRGFRMHQIHEMHFHNNTFRDISQDVIHITNVENLVVFHKNTFENNNSPVNFEIIDDSENTCGLKLDIKYNYWRWNRISSISHPWLIYLDLSRTEVCTQEVDFSNNTLEENFFEIDDPKRSTIYLRGIYGTFNWNLLHNVGNHYEFRTYAGFLTTQVNYIDVRFSYLNSSRPNVVRHTFYDYLVETGYGYILYSPFLPLPDRNAPLDHRLCDDGWRGDACDVFDCSLVDDCNSRGQCIGPMICECNDGYFGESCQYPLCYGIPSNETSVCTFQNGTCVAPDTCDCNNGYTGNICQYPSCFGIFSNENAVCNHRNGTCVIKDHCDCNEGYIGTSCEIPLCFGKISTDTDVCNFGNGTCIRKDTCICNTGFSGDNCQYPICFGVEQSNNQVCNMRNGTCVLPDKCECNGFVGYDCSIPICFTIRGDDLTVCNNQNGTCVHKDQCNCNEGYMGSECQTPICFGITSTNPDTCSSRGSCVASDQCACNNGYLGSNCEYSICYGIPGDDSSVCSSNGNCTEIDNCECDDGWGGSQCNSILCFGVDNSDTHVCSSNGICSSPNQCSCYFGWRSHDCSIATECFGIAANHSSVCSQHGTCVDEDQCSCYQDYSGLQCQDHVCYGIGANDVSVCNHGNGTCVSHDNCVCDVGYYGNQCEFFNCFGVQFIDTENACSGNGICLRPDICVCNQGFTGANCDIPLCFGTNASDSNVCHGNGNCITTDTCSCFDQSHYVGAECEIPVCFGFDAQNMSTCSSKGACVSPNVCQCNTGYYGNQCQEHACFGTQFQDPSTCYGNGTCDEPDKCTCNSGYTGEQCNIPICYGLDAEHPEVCNYRNGSCILKDICECRFGFSGMTCDYPSCFGINSTDQMTCSSHGNCIHLDQCECNDGYYGIQCDLYDCFNIQRHDHSVCSNMNGTCNAPDSCICNHGYTGSQCEIPICFGIQSTDPRVCSYGNGSCVSKDHCVCADGYTGSQCEHLLCFGKSSSDNTVCNHQNGTCIAYNVCQCDPEYTGDECQYPFCFGISSEEASVCSYRNGTCILPNTCQCNEGYIGNQCEIPICFGRQAFDNAVCSNHNGTCVSHDTCLCNENYIGSECQYPICFGVASTDSHVCSNSNGTCIKENTCNCNEGYTGIQCEIPICYSIRADSQHACSGHGVCVSKDNCSCYEGYISDECEIPICFGRNSNDENVCSGLGTCTAPNVCVCTSGYVGNECETVTCFGVEQHNLTSVCSGHGICLSLDNCSCINARQGDRCDTFSCFGIDKDNSSVCSGRGICGAPDVCFCPPGHKGLECEYPVCYGVISTAVVVCSSHGDCINPDHCNCSSGYTGHNCQTPICHGVLATNPAVCSSNGTCVAPDLCECLSGYTDGQCETSMCFEKNISDPSVCSGKGQCIGPNMCDCNDGYYGEECEFYNCDNILFSDQNVCGGKGLCLEPGNCGCPNGYSGTNCQIIECHGKWSNNSEVCSGRGVCISHNQCQCLEGIVGVECQQFVCFGFTSNSPQVCNHGNGTCEGVNSCTCNEGYYGELCDIPSCFGHLSNDPLVCSSHGQCISRDLCVCDQEYGSTDCSVPLCFGILGDRSEVCTGNGNCSEPNNCTCHELYYGENCELQQYSQCFGLPSIDPLVCGGNGYCVEDDLCVCNETHTGLECDIPLCFGLNATDENVCSSEGRCSRPDHCDCKPYFFGDKCNTFCDPLSTCSGHGECDAVNGSCICHNSTDDGHWQGEKCDKCQIGFHGAMCRRKIGLFRFSDDGSRIVGMLGYDSAVHDAWIDCSKMFIRSSIERLGTSPKCWWPNENREDFEIILGSNAKIMPYEFIVIDEFYYFFEESKTIFTVPVQVLPPLNAMLPVASISRTSNMFDPCVNISFDASSSFSLDRRELNYQWSFLAGKQLSLLNQFASTVYSSVIVIPSDFIETNQDYEIQLIVTDFIGRSSHPVSRRFQRASTSIPSARIIGPATHIVHRSFTSSYRVMVELDSNTQACSSINLDYMNYSWKQNGNMEVSFVQRGLDLEITKFPSNEDHYHFSMVFELEYMSVTQQLEVLFYVIIQNVVSVIDGGRERTHSFSRDFQLSGLNSHDPEMLPYTPSYLWNCVNVDLDEPCSLSSNSNFNPTSSVVSINAQSLLPGSYLFLLKFSVGKRHSTAQTLVHIVDDDTVFNVNIDPIPSIISLHSNRLILKAVIESGIATFGNNVRYQWKVTNVLGNEIDLNLPGITRSNINESSLILNPSFLSQGVSYQFSVTASHVVDGSIYHSHSFVESRIPQAPLQGIVAIEPGEGTAFQTVFKIHCHRFFSEFSPLEYSVSYIDENRRLNMLTAFSVNSEFSLRLPPGARDNGDRLVLVITVRDSVGMTVQHQLSVISKSSSSSLIEGEQQTDIFEFAQNFTHSLSSAVEKASLSASRLFSTLETTSLLSIFLSDIEAMEDIEYDVKSSETVQCSRDHPVEQYCPFNCSGRGQCIIEERRCSCQSGYYGMFCSLTSNKFMKRKQIKNELVQKLSDIFRMQIELKRDDSDSIMHPISLLQRLSIGSNELNGESRMSIIRLIDFILSNSFLSDKHSASLLQVISNLYESFEDRVERSNQDINESRMLDAVFNRLLTSLGKSKVVGELETNIRSKKFSCSIFKASLQSDLSKKSFRLCSRDNPFVDVRLSTNLANSKKRRSQKSIALENDSSEIEMHFSVIERNNETGAYDTKFTHQFSNMMNVRISFLTPSSDIVQYLENDEKVFVSIPVNANLPLSLENYTTICGNWNEEEKKWVEGECKVGSITDQVATCECPLKNLELSLFFNYVDRSVYEKENLHLQLYDNFTGISIISVWNVIHFLAATAILLISLCSGLWNMKKSKQMDDFVIKTEHIFVERVMTQWLDMNGIFGWIRALKKKQFTRVLNYTLCIHYFGIVSMFINSYASYKGDLTHWIIQGIGLGLLATIASRIIFVLLQYTNGNVETQQQHVNNKISQHMKKVTGIYERQVESPQVSIRASKQKDSTSSPMIHYHQKGEIDRIDGEKFLMKSCSNSEGTLQTGYGKRLNRLLMFMNEIFEMITNLSIPQKMVMSFFIGICSVGIYGILVFLLGFSLIILFEEIPILVLIGILLSGVFLLLCFLLYKYLSKLEKYRRKLKKIITSRWNTIFIVIMIILFPLLIVFNTICLTISVVGIQDDLILYSAILFELFIYGLLLLVLLFFITIIKLRIYRKRWWKKIAKKLHLFKRNATTLFRYNPISTGKFLNTRSSDTSSPASSESSNEHSMIESKLSSGINDKFKTFSRATCLILLVILLEIGSLALSTFAGIKTMQYDMETLGHGERRSQQWIVAFTISLLFEIILNSNMIFIIHFASTSIADYTVKLFFLPFLKAQDYSTDHTTVEHEDTGNKRRKKKKRSATSFSPDDTKKTVSHSKSRNLACYQVK